MAELHAKRVQAAAFVFFLGFGIPLLGVKFEFPYVIYQGLTIYLVLAIGWHGGEELASLSAGSLQQALGFMFVGFITNFYIGIVAYYILRYLVRLRKIDATTVAGYYGSDSAGTFVTCVGVLTASSIAYAPSMGTSRIHVQWRRICCCHYQEAVNVIHDSVAPCIESLEVHRGFECSGMASGTAAMSDSDRHRRAVRLIPSSTAEAIQATTLPPAIE